MKAVLNAWARAHHSAPVWPRRFFYLGLVAGLAWASCEAAAQTPLANRRDAPAKVATASPAPAKPPPRMVTVWTGVDVDGDGQPDFGNPTGEGVRADDAFGSGHFGASRDGGARQHEGVDYKSEPGEVVKAPISGYVTHIGFAYPDDPSLRYIQISNPAIGYVARVFYTQPGVKEGQAVALGQPIGRAQSLQGRYAGITNHVHLEIAKARGDKIDSTRLIYAKLEPATAQG